MSLFARIRLDAERQGKKAIDWFKKSSAIARKDAEILYRDLSGFRIIIEQRPDGWHVGYESNDVYLKGGGPHYVIDAMTGIIVSKRYEQ